MPYATLTIKGQSVGFRYPFHQTSYQTEIGQTLDLLTSSDVVDFSRFTLERYVVFFMGHDCESVFLIVQLQSYCEVQDCILLILSTCGSGNVHGG